MKSCTFIGHKDFSVTKYTKLYLEIEKLIVEEKVDLFYVGTHGCFDKLVYLALCELQKQYNITILVVLAYLNQQKDNIYYDMKRTIFPEILETTPPKFAITARNKYMIKKSQFMICGIDNTFSNSYPFVEFALKNNLKIINIGTYKINQ